MLNNNWLIQKLDVVKSTQDYAREFIIGDSQVVILAKEQTHGYGQYGRQWKCLEGNLFTSLIFNNNKPMSQITYIVGIAIGETINLLKKDLEIKYKWVNDIVIRGKKVAGILTEQINGKVIIGIGLNIKSHPEIDQATTDLLENGLETTPEEFIAKFLKIFTEFYNEWKTDGFTKFRNLWKAKAFKINELISIKSGDKTITGTFCDIDSIDGSLVIQDNKQQLIKLQTGSLIL